MEIEFELPEWAAPFLEPARYKIAYGGRGSSKSWTFARILAWQAASSTIRVLCARETQKSIEESVHQVLADQIKQIGLESQFEVLNNEIRHKTTGSQFVYAGLKQHVIANIKSYEGFDRCWVAEAHTVSKKSWDVLEPTIRKPGSEFWIDLNPELDTDETYDRFVVNPPKEAVLARVNWRDNPWFTAELEQQRLRTKDRDPKGYDNIWEGKPRIAVEGAIFADEVIEATEHGRICNVPYDSKLKVHAVFDLGWNDQTSIILVQRHLSELRVIEYIEDDHRTLDWYSAELRNRHYNWGKVFLPHDGTHANIQTGVSAAHVLRGLKWSVHQTPNVPIEVGIKQARMAFNKVYFDKTKSERLIQCLKRYKRNIPVTTGEPAAPVHDEYSHGADAFRYMALSAASMTNEELKPIAYKNTGVI